MKIFNQLKNIYSKFHYILTRKERRGCIIVFIFLCIGSLFEMIGVTAIVPLVQVILMPENLLDNPGYSFVWRFFHVNDSSDLVILISAGTILIYLFKNLYMTFLSFFKNRFYRKVEREISMRLMDSYLRRDYVFHINTNSATLLRSVVYDITGVTSTLTSIFTITMECISALLIVVVLFVTDYIMAMTLMCSALAALAVSILGFRKTMRREGQNAIKYAQLSLKAVNEAFNGIKDVMVTRRQSFFAEKFDQAIKKKNKANATKNFAAECPAYVIEGTCVCAIILMLCVQSLTGQNDTEFVSHIAAFAMAAFRILPSVGKITNNYNTIVYYRAMLDEVYMNICEAKEYSEERLYTPDQAECYMGSEAGKCDSNGKRKFIGELTLENVSWRYPGAEEAVVESLNMTIRKGRAIGFIGESGAGKTTLADMILGLLPTQAGAIKVDGVDIKDIPGDWSRIIGYVPQTVYLTDDTIRNNVAFGIPAERIDDEKIWKALEQAQLKKFVQGLSEGLDTIVGEKGIRFSGGQRQRVAIARALYCDPDILVLDEATSALDNQTESAVMEAIESLQGVKTLIIVAHRLTTIQSCDEVYEIRGGKAILQEGQERYHD